MTGGLRIAGAAMSNFSARHDVISNNLANVSTPGFARQDTFVERLGSVAAEPFRNPEVQTRTDFDTAGPPLLTGNHLDLSLEGTGFFALDTPDGVRYTRNVSLETDAAGLLRDSSGHPVLGEAGLLAVGDRLVTVEKDGEVMLTDKDDTELRSQDFLDRLRIVTFRSGADLVREEGGLYRARPGRKEDSGIDRPIVHAGQLEGSAVQPVPELVRMIEAMRSYEAAASALRATDRTLDRAVNDIARA